MSFWWGWVPVPSHCSVDLDPLILNCSEPKRNDRDRHKGMVVLKHPSWVYRERGRGLNRFHMLAVSVLFICREELKLPMLFRCSAALFVPLSTCQPNQVYKSISLTCRSHQQVVYLKGASPPPSLSLSVYSPVCSTTVCARCGHSDRTKRGQNDSSPADD